MIVYGAKKNFNISAKVAIESERVNEWMKAKILFAVYLGQQNLLSMRMCVCLLHDSLRLCETQAHIYSSD